MRVLSVALLCVVLSAPRTQAASPVAAIDPVTDDYFGTKIVDPYRWMESEPQPQFNAYLHAENNYARAVLAHIPGRDALAKQIGEVSGLAAAVGTVDLAGTKRVGGGVGAECVAIDDLAGILLDGRQLLPTHAIP